MPDALKRLEAWLAEKIAVRHVGYMARTRTQWVACLYESNLHLHGEGPTLEAAILDALEKANG